MDPGDLLTDHLAVWIVAAAGIGLLLPDLAVLSPLALPILAVMIGSMALTLSWDRFRQVHPRTVGRLLGLHLAVAPLAFGIATVLELPPALVLGFVILGAVTPELTTPVMTHLADGDVPLATTVLVLAGFVSVVAVPAWAVLLAGEAVPVSPVRILIPVVGAVALPSAVALGIRRRFPERIAAREELYPKISALMVVLVIAIVAAGNAEVVRGNLALVAVAAVGAVVLNVAGYGLGWLGATGLDPGSHRAFTLSIGMRDFAVAAGIVLAAGLPAEAALPAVVFGVVEMVSAAWLAGRMRGRGGG